MFFNKLLLLGVPYLHFNGTIHLADFVVLVVVSPSEKAFFCPSFHVNYSISHGCYVQTLHLYPLKGSFNI